MLSLLNRTPGGLIGKVNITEHGIPIGFIFFKIIHFMFEFTNTD